MGRVLKVLKQAACHRTPKDEDVVNAADLPRSARGRHAGADAPAETPTTGLRLKLPAATEASLTPPVTWQDRLVIACWAPRRVLTRQCVYFVMAATHFSAGATASLLKGMCELLQCLMC